ncbi:MAG: hypothetical protein RLY37_1020 [Verrucomicrobiota bacterium]
MSSSVTAPANSRSYRKGRDGSPSRPLSLGRDVMTSPPPVFLPLPTANRLPPPPRGSVARVGAGPRHDIAVSGRVEHPCSTAADQGWSALPFAAGRTKVGARFIVHSFVGGRGKATPLPSAALRRPPILNTRYSILRSEIRGSRRGFQIHPASSAIVSILCSRSTSLAFTAATSLASSSFWATSCWRRATMPSMLCCVFT